MSALSPRRRIRTVEEAGAYLSGLINVEKERRVPYTRFDLEPIRRLTTRLGSPQDELSVIHLAGSKGKGSTALFAEGLLLAADERVGTFTSPHLERWTERFRIDGREVGGALLAAAVERVAVEVEALQEADPERAPTFFDATTAVALLLFREAKVDRAVIEVGLGGRLDSTNVVSPAVTCITGIELEHTEQLGNTLAAVAAEKAGILKPGVPAVLGQLADEARAVVEARAAAVGAPLSVLGRDFQLEVLDESLDGLSLRLVDGELRVNARLPALGLHQARNAALALACAKRIPHAEAGLAERIARSAAKGFGATELPGRIELIARSPWLLVDSAHTGASAAALSRVLKRIPANRSHLVLSISSGKDTEAILQSLVPGVEEVTVTRAEPLRSLSPVEIAKAVRSASPRAEVHVIPNPHLAVRSALDRLEREDLLCVAGSIYLAGIARAVLRGAAVSRRGE